MEAKDKFVYKPSLFIDTEAVKDENKIRELYTNIAQDEGTITPRSFIQRIYNSTDKVTLDFICNLLSANLNASEAILNMSAAIHEQGKVSSMYGMAEASYKSILGTVNGKSMLNLNFNLQRLKILYDSFDELSQMTQSLFLQDIYSYSDATRGVTKYGINERVSGLSEFISKYNAKLTELNAFDYNDTKSEISTTSKQKGKSSTPEKTIISLLRPEEVYVLFKAIDHLLSDVNKVALVDIYARESNGNIKQNNNLPETHSVVLFKNPTTNQILIIDPNNSELSKHIAEPYSSDILKSLFVEKYPSIEIIANEQKIEIYKGPGKRNCVDIAVKIGLGLLDPKSTITVAKVGEPPKQKNIIKLKDISIIQQITNDELINDNLSSDMGDPKIRQSSDPIVRKKVNGLIDAIQSQLDYILDCNDELKYQTVTEQYYNILKSDVANNPDCYSNCIVDLIALHVGIASNME